MNRNEKIDEIIEILLSLKDPNSFSIGDDIYGEIKILPQYLEFQNCSDLERRFKELLPDEK